MSFLVEIVKWLLEFLLKWGIEEIRRCPTMEDGAPPGALEEKLREKLQRDGWIDSDGNEIMHSGS